MYIYVGSYDVRALKRALRYTRRMLEKAYDPKAVEDRIYEVWEKSGAFKPESCDPKAESFTISMPPPNATGQLHLGHAVMLALEDIFIRFARMRGKKVLVHCQVNMRASSMVFLHRVIVGRESPEEAYKSVIAVWAPHDAWKDLIVAELRRNDIAFELY